MKYYAVIDTNVLVSAMLKGTSIPGIIIDQALNGSIIPLVNIEILNEYRDVLNRGKFHFDSSDVSTLIDELSKRAIFLDRTETNELFDDPDDIVFYEITLTATASTSTYAYLITGNKKHFPQKPFVVTPHEMLDIISQE